MRKTIAFMAATVLALPIGSALADDAGQAGREKTTTQQMGSQSGSKAGLMSADDIVGSSVRDTDGKDIGQVEDLMVSSDGKIESAIVSLGGVLGVGGRQVKVPFDSLDLKRDASNPDKIYAQASRQTLESAPAYDEDTRAAADRDTTGTDADEPRSARGDEPMNPLR